MKTNTLFIDESRDSIYWIEQNTDKSYTLRFAPIMGNDLVQLMDGGDVELWGETIEEEIRIRGIFEMLKQHNA